MKPNDGSDASSHPTDEASISGIIEFPDVREPAHNVTVHVQVQVTTFADAPAVTVAELVLPGVDIAPGVLPIPFALHGIPLKAGARYVIRVHADVNGNGAVSRGDYVSSRSYPVENTGKPASVIISTRYVG
jgi:putative lipoprotein